MAIYDMVRTCIILTDHVLVVHLSLAHDHVQSFLGIDLELKICLCSLIFVHCHEVLQVVFIEGNNLLLTNLSSTVFNSCALMHTRVLNADRGHWVLCCNSILLINSFIIH